MKPINWQALLLNLLLWVSALLCVAPLLWMVAVSLMPSGAANHSPPPLWPQQASLDHYRSLFAANGMGRYFVNSLLVASLAALLSTLFNTMAGYAFAKLQFKGRERLFGSLLALLVIPGQVAMLPLFLLLKQMGLVNSYAGVLIPSLAGVFGIFLVRQYASSLPNELLEAARIDGAGEIRIFVSIILPLLQPVVVTSALFAFLGSWNDFMWPLIVLSDGELHTLPVALAALSREHIQDSELMMAGAVVTVLPVLLLFITLQRYYIQGLTMGAIK